MTQIQDEGVGKTVAVSPILVENTKIAICDDDGNEQQTDLAELRSSEGILDPNQASLNIDNSTDVIVGPVTQFMGPVTIFQNVNGQINPPNRLDQNPTIPRIQTPPPTTTPQQYAESKFSSTAPSINEKADANFGKKYKIKSKYLLYAILVAVLIFIFVGISYLIISKNSHPDQPSSSHVLETLTTAPSRTVKNDISDISKPPRFQLIDREQWGANPPLSTIPPLSHPIETVIIKHTASHFGNNYRDCCQLVKNLQKFFQDHKKLDIDYNFLICGDENVYVGRGWNFQNDFRKNTILLTFMGNFAEGHHILTDGMEKMALMLLNEAVKNKTLTENYKIVPHNQVENTFSPGKNVLRVIKNWEHFNDNLKQKN